MSNQYFIYNTDDNGWVNSNRIINIVKGQQRVIRAAGLSEELQIYQMVGECAQCTPNDVLWEPVYVCGEPLTLSSTNNTIWLTIPGRYSIGDPTDDSTLAGDVNITGESHKGVDLSTMGKCESAANRGEDCDNPEYVYICQDETDPVQVTFPADDLFNGVTLDVNVSNDSTDPVPVILAPGQLGIETSMVNLGCSVDGSDNETGEVILVKTTDEGTGAETTRMVAYLFDGTIIDPYTGTWRRCVTDEVTVDNTVANAVPVTGGNTTPVLVDLPDDASIEIESSTDNPVNVTFPSDIFDGETLEVEVTNSFGSPVPVTLTPDAHQYSTTLTSSNSLAVGAGQNMNAQNRTGLVVEFSHDGTNWFELADRGSMQVDANTTVRFRIPGSFTADATNPGVVAATFG